MSERSSEPIELRAIGAVRSAVRDPREAARQPDEGAPPARIQLDPAYVAGLHGLSAGDAVIVLTWLHLADRDVLSTRPRDDVRRPVVGVFATRSPDRPNPVGLHLCTIRGVDTEGMDVDALEAIDGTPVLDIKPLLGDIDSR